MIACFDIFFFFHVTQYSVTFMVNNLRTDSSIFHMAETPGKELEFILIDLLSILSGEELSLIGSHLEFIFPHLGVVPRPNHCSIYIHDLFSSAVSVDISLKEVVFGSETSTKMSVIRQIFFLKNEGFFKWLDQ